MQALIYYLVLSCPLKTGPLPLNFPRCFPSCGKFVGGRLPLPAGGMEGMVREPVQGGSWWYYLWWNCFRITPQKSVFSTWSLSASASIPSGSSVRVGFPARQQCVFFIEILLRSLQIMQLKKNNLERVYAACEYIEMWLLFVCRSCELAELQDAFYYFFVDVLGFST